MATYVNIPPAGSSSSSLSNDWTATMSSIFANATGLTSLQYVAETGAAPVEDFNSSAGNYVNDVIASGAGASLAANTGLGSILQMVSPNATTAGSAEWYPGAAAGGVGDQIPSSRFRRWMVAARVAVAATRITGLSFTCGLRIGASHSVGFGFNGAPTNWQALIDKANVLDSGVACVVGSDGTYNFLNGYIANFNFADLVVNLAPGVGADVVLTNGMSTVTQGTCRPWLGLVGDGTQIVNQTMYVDRIVCLRET